MIFDQPGNYTNSDSISDGVTVTVAGVSLTNTSGGRVLGSGITHTAAGSTFINESGAEVGERNSLSWYPNVLVQGSSGTDTVINGGIVFGMVRLGEGNDSFVDRNGLVQGSGWQIYLEGGDDTLRLEGGGIGRGAIFANGGDGIDTVVVASTGSDPRTAALFGFERLILEGGGNIVGYSGFQTVVLAATQALPFYNFVDSINPEADLQLSQGQYFAMARSEFRSITGTDGGNSVELFSSGFSSRATRVLDNVRLGGGSDSFTINAFYGGINPIVGGIVDGGDGWDSVNLVVGNAGNSGGTINLDLAQVVGFERLFVNAQYNYLNASVTLNHLAGFQTILAGETTNLILSSTGLPGAELRGAAGGSVTLGSDVVIGSYSAFRYDPMPGWPAETEVDLPSSVTFVNNGTVTASIRFAGGFDHYDGRQGSVGGIVDGGAGDDRLIGGVGVEHLVGGAGNDVLVGGGGADWLDGGGGDDRLIVEADESVSVGDRFAGGIGEDMLEFRFDPNDADLRVIDLRGAAIDHDVEVLRGPAVVVTLAQAAQFEQLDVEELHLGGDGEVSFAGILTTGLLFLHDEGNRVTLSSHGFAGTIGGAADDIVTGNAADDRIWGGGGSDILTGGGGDDAIDGGAGIDTATYSGLFRSYAVAGDNGIRTVSGGAEGGTDTLASIEVIQFRDGRFDFDANGAAAQVTRLYDTALQRAPDQVGLDYFVDLLEDHGATLDQIATSFLNSPEFQALTGSLSNADYVEFLYQHALDRASDPDGKSYYIDLLSRGAASRADILVSFSESPEHRTATVDLVNQGFFNTDDNYQAVALMYDTFANRLPDEGGLIFWAEALRNGSLTLDQMADNFAASPEFSGLTSGMTNAQLVGFMYENALNRPGGSSELQYWTERLDGGMDRGDLLIGFSQSNEHFSLLGAHVTNGIDYL